MTVNIEGVGNLFKISAFVNRKHVKDGCHLDKLEEVAILANVPDTKKLVPPDEIYNRTMKLLNEEMKKISSAGTITRGPNLETTRQIQEVPRKMEAPRQEPAEVARPMSVLPKPSAENMPDDNLLLKNFDFTSKSSGTRDTEERFTSPTVKTSFERTKFNDLLYGGADNPDEDDTERLSLYENVTDLRRELGGINGVNIDNIPLATEATTVSELRRIKKLLMFKKNSVLNFETARDFMLIGINQITQFCNGKNGRPNLVGWDTTAQAKLNMLRTEVSSIAADFFKRWDIGSLGQIAISLVPSAVFYALTRKDLQTSLNRDNTDALQKLQTLMKD